MTRRRGYVIGAAVPVVAALTACGASGHRSTAPTSAPKSPVASAVQLKQNPLPSVLPTNEPAVRSDVVQTSCAAIPGGWSASGTVKNSSSHKRTYNILVYFTTTHATTLDFATATVPVDGGKSAPWKAEKKFAAQSAMLCPMPSISAS